MVLNDTLNKRFPVLISAIFLVFSVAIVLHHEIWMDEAYHFLLARDSASLVDVFRNGTQTGHPVFWNSVLFGYKHLFSTVLSMQLLHCFIASICVFLINRYSPFSLFENICITFGYFFLYEYNIIAKNYILGFCIIFVSLILYDRKKPFWLITSLLAIACNFHLFTLFVSVSFFLYVVFKKYAKEKELLFCCGLMIIGIICAFIQIIPSTQHINEYKSYDSPSFFALDRLGRSLGVICRGLFNIPDFRKPDYWNSNVFFNLNRILCYVLSLAAMLLVWFSLKRHQLIALLFFVPTSLIMIFVYITPLSTGVRYWGYCYILLIICFWLYKRYDEPKLYSRLFFNVVLCLQVLISIPALAIEYSKPFSNAKYATLSLQNNNLESHTLFVQSLGLGPSLSAYANKKVYYPANKTFESFSYDINNKKYSSNEFLSESLNDLKQMKLNTCVLVMNESLDSLLTAKKSYTLQKIAEHTGAIITSENYYLYLLSTH